MSSSGPDLIHAAGAEYGWTRCSRLVISPDGWAGTVKKGDVRLHADGGDVTCPQCKRLLRSDAARHGVDLAVWLVIALAMVLAILGIASIASGQTAPVIL